LEVLDQERLGERLICVLLKAIDQPNHFEKDIPGWIKLYIKYYGTDTSLLGELTRFFEENVHRTGSPEQRAALYGIESADFLVEHWARVMVFISFCCQ
jgi:hypothetical protein